MNNKKFPQYLTAPYQVLWFETDDLAIVALCFLLAMMFGNFFWLLLIAGPYSYMKFKYKYPRGFFRHVIYFLGLIDMKNYPTYFEKEFTE